MSEYSEPSELRELRESALAALLLTEPDAKCAAVLQWLAPEVTLDTAKHFPDEVDHRLPGRPARPVLLDPRQVPRRSLGPVQGRAALIHALAHIEFNAINLALDVLWRFPGLPEDFYRDWARVACEEASHFQLLREHLRSLGADYGDFAAHNGLWEMAEKTKYDLLARLALVARTLEARGLDVSPGLRDRLASAGDGKGAEILSLILRDEIGHVAIGSRWFHQFCTEGHLDSAAVQRELAIRYAAPMQRGPFNLEARRAAGFTQTELDALVNTSAVSATPMPQQAR